MSELNTNIPSFECLVRREYLYDHQSGRGEYEQAVVFAAASVPGRALGFHALLGCGATYGRLPITALASKDSLAPSISEVQLWDCPSENISCVTYDFLKESRCHVMLPSGQHNGTYMFTLDWWGGPHAESAGNIGWKPAHVILLDNGWFVAQPSNRILFENPCFIKKVEKPDYKLSTRVYKCEQGGTTTDEYFYRKDA